MVARAGAAPSAWAIQMKEANHIQRPYKLKLKAGSGKRLHEMHVFHYVPTNMRGSPVRLVFHDSLA